MRTALLQSHNTDQSDCDWGGVWGVGMIIMYEIFAGKTIL